MKFNKEGSLLAVNTAENGIKILANATGLRSLRVAENQGFEPLRAPIEPATIKVLSHWKIIFVVFFLDPVTMKLHFRDCLSRFLVFRWPMLLLSVAKWKEAPLSGLLQSLYVLTFALLENIDLFPTLPVFLLVII